MQLWFLWRCFHQAELLFPVSHSLLIQLKTVVQKNVELQLNQLSELADFMATQMLLLMEEEEEVAMTTLFWSSSVLVLLKLVKKLGSLNWDCGGPAALTVHLPLLARKPLWLWVRQSQGVNQAGNELLFRFVAFWLDHVFELADHPDQGERMGLPIDVNEMGVGDGAGVAPI